MLSDNQASGTGEAGGFFDQIFQSKRPIRAHCGGDLASIEVGALLSACRATASFSCL